MRRTLANVTSVVGGEVLLRVANLFAGVVIARIHGAPTLGLYATALGVATVAAMLADNGLQISAITEISGKPSAASHLTTQLFAAKTLLFLPMTAVLLLVGAVSHLSPLAYSIFALVTLRTVLQCYCQLNLAILKSLDRMLVISGIQTLHFTILVFGISLIYHYHLRIELLLSVLIMGQLLEFVLSSWCLRSLQIRIQRVTWHECIALVRRSTSVGLTYSMANLILRLDVLLLAILVSPAIVGHFAAGQMLMAMFYVVSWLFGSVLLPEMARLAIAGNGLEQYTRMWSNYLLVITIPASLLAFWLAPYGIRLLYGEGFRDTGEVVAIMVFAVPAILLNSLYLHRAMALGQSIVYLSIYGATLLLTVVLDLSFGHVLGPKGIAIAIVARELSMYAMFRHSEGKTLRSNMRLGAVSVDNH